MTAVRMHQTDYLFVYGTLVDPKANPWAARLWRGARAAGEGWFQGRLYRVAHYPGVVPSDDPDDKVRGQLVRLSRPAAILPALDAYEGVPDLYIRQQALVTKVGGEQVMAWIYIYNRPVDRLSRIRSGDFRRVFSS